ncbi:biotin--[acetyl-CoA-carboxylase] ligase [Plebeiibacterium sediminum]|uniref:Biotin--[acetyl-CoA-carboxylase] ligase n=1 Tax=Plebeiibacterium sediminum TaxID=2992112 RepID=A0AAE3SD83_9BACT|nr:biotin--[acetyl-CoA-carboxylase] ligase [Plebeiobacterium sediminum]MCW3784963.1 biotin--[acetyl-CoA-carboxylase] ligase [Plebeiobacterium sediminum]
MTKNANFIVDRYDNLPSTNEKMKSLISGGLPEFAVIIANHQSAGKGQKGNTWESESGKNLTFSLLFRPDFILAQDQFIISKIVCLGILDVLSMYSGDFSIKWPNDIYFRDLKIGGILIENALYTNLIGSSVVGIGLNINQEIFYSDAPNPVSLKNITNKEFNLENMLDDILNAIYALYSEAKLIGYDNINTRYLDRLFRKDGIHPFRDGQGNFEARIDGISEYGQLILSKENGQKMTYSFKEVEFLI